MKKDFTVGLIRVVTMADENLMGLHGRIIEENYPGIKVISKCIPDQPEGIHSPETKEMALPKIVALAKTFKNVDMIIVSCADDPAVELIREAIPNIPVTGGGETTAALALKYGEPMGLLGITDYAPDPYLKLMDKIVGVARPDGVESTLDLMTEKGRAAVLGKALELKSNGAKVIALACTGMATIGIAKELEKEVGIPVIDPVLAEGLFAYFEAVRRG